MDDIDDTITGQIIKFNMKTKLHIIRTNEVQFYDYNLDLNLINTKEHLRLNSEEEISGLMIFHINTYSRTK